MQLHTKMVAIFHFALAMALSSGQVAGGDHPMAPDESRPTLFIIGDSTVNNQTLGLLGWGSCLAEYFDPAKINMENRATGGRSSRTFYTEGFWAGVMEALKPGDFVLIQFDHDDGGSLTEGGARGSLRGAGDEAQEVVRENLGQKEVVHTYGWYLRKYIRDTKAKGATPIVLSLVPRNIWREGTVIRASNDYGKWAAETAISENAFFIDWNEIVAKHYEQAGREKVASTFFAEDHKHTTKAGAELNARSVVKGIRTLKHCPLRTYLLKAPADSENGNSKKRFPW